MATPVRTSNPALNERTFAPERLHNFQKPAPEAGTAPGAPAWRTTMTIDGVVTKSLFLLVLLVAAATVSWQAVPRDDFGGVQFPGWLFVALIGGFVTALVTIFRPNLARYTAPLYAVLEGVVVGGISAVYESQFDGIVLQAVGLTIGVFVALLGAFSSGLIKVTEKFRLGVVAATGAVMLVYVATFVMRLFGGDMPFIHGTGLVGIGFSLAVVVIASLNLVLDFDFIQQGVARSAPKMLEWYAAFGLLVTLVWLYLELLRLLSKLRSR